MNRRRNPPWSEEELILALDFYLQFGALHARHSEVIRLSNALNGLAIHIDRPDEVKFRNPNGVALKLANFAALDPSYPGRGMSRGGKLDRAIWAKYSSNEDTLSAMAAEIFETGAVTEPDPIATGEAGIIEAEVEAQHVEEFTVRNTIQTYESRRREQQLVLSFAEHLKTRGHTVKRHLYAVPGESGLLSCDLVDLTEQTLYEAKSNVKRTSIRLAIGQLMDYSRFESKAMRLAILLPRCPSSDLQSLALSVPVATVWRTGEGWGAIRH